MELPQQDNDNLRARSAPPNVTPERWLLNSRSRNKRPQSQRRGSQPRPVSSAGPSKREPALAYTSVVRTPGYTLTRTPSAVKMDINTSVFFGNPPMDVQESQEQKAAFKEDGARDSPVSSSVMRSATLAQAIRAQEALQVEIAALNIKMEDQKRNFEEETKQREEEYKKEKEKLIKQHELEKENMEQRHHDELQSAHDKHFDELRAVREPMEHEIADSKEQLLLAKEASELKVVESEKALRTELQESKISHNQELNQLKKRLGEQATLEVDQLRDKLIEEHRQEVDELNSEREQELKVMMRKIDEAVKLKEDLQKAFKKSKKLEREISKQKEKLQASNIKQTSTEAKLTEAETKVKEFEVKFDDKVKQVEANYRDRLDGVMIENTYLRQRLMKNTESFSRYKSNVERLQAEKITSLIDRVQILVKARQQASLSVAIGAHEPTLQSSPENRPNSTPVTRSERNQTRQQTAGNRPPHL